MIWKVVMGQQLQGCGVSDWLAVLCPVCVLSASSLPIQRVMET